MNLRKQITYHNYFKLIVASALVSFCSLILVFITQQATEHVEDFIFETVSSTQKIFLVFLPTIGITAIYFLRKLLFKGRKNKGITEIYKTLDQRKDHLPAFKIPSHLINGFLTVSSGGSTGIEVSSVVATATVGNMIHNKHFSANIFKKELICSGVTAAVALLFASPLAGFLFAIEVIARKKSKSLFLSCGTAALLAWLFILLLDYKPLLSFPVEGWHGYALPLFLILGLLSGLLSVYFTLLTTRMKKIFGNINNNFLRVNLGAISVGLFIFIFPALYGDSYHGLKEILYHPQAITFYTLAILILLKPLAASLTLGAGGDGGVFAPSIVAGAFLGLLFAQICNAQFDLQLIPLNFALVGAAATLSASIYAPLTALILVCNLVPNGYQLFIPLLVGSFTANYFSKQILPYNVYTYDFYLTKN
ncbi:chloride channel protein [Myroides sp. WP-1]|uniref:chloride channel protein n=1 Tax=Myroides sp. WP-1 TaxID=2759944 RepID=UPI0015FA798F|nr:chloride channel protein [Myroides sp. WP-1]MBB1138152.1 chloride channel protein [Myroides sp. WP-1]